MDQQSAQGDQEVINNKADNPDLNQFGRPKQRVVFYELTEDMKKEAI